MVFRLPVLKVRLEGLTLEPDVNRAPQGTQEARAEACGYSDEGLNSQCNRTLQGAQKIASLSLRLQRWKLVSI